MDRGRCILAKVAEWTRNSRWHSGGDRMTASANQPNAIRTFPNAEHMKGETMKIATLVLFSVMMMVPSPTLFSAPFQKDKPAEVDRAEQSLHTAKGELEKAGTEWGGHRVAAIKHIDAALKELEQAEAWARQHHEMK